MNKFKKIKDKFNALSLSKKIQVIAASVLTLAALIALPVYAWFALSSGLETLTKIEEPTELDIRAGNEDPVVNFDLSNIDIESIVGDEDNPGKPEYRVFSVSSGKYNIPYYLQVAHTTNIPLKYEIYKLTFSKSGEIKKETGAAGTTTASIVGDTTYVVYNSKVDEKAYTYTFKDEDYIELKPKNIDGGSQSNYGRKTAERSGNYYNKTYNSGTDTPELYAVPVYLQTEEEIKKTTETAETDYFVLKLSYDPDAVAKQGFNDWNAAKNNKETDIIYITAEKVKG